DGCGSPGRCADAAAALTSAASAQAPLTPPGTGPASMHPPACVHERMGSQEASGSVMSVRGAAPTLHTADSSTTARVVEEQQGQQGQQTSGPCTNAAAMQVEGPPPTAAGAGAAAGRQQRAESMEVDTAEAARGVGGESGSAGAAGAGQGARQGDNAAQLPAADPATWAQPAAAAPATGPPAPTMVMAGEEEGVVLAYMPPRSTAAVCSRMVLTPACLPSLLPHLPVWVCTLYRTVLP
ncbi:hypothetical protein V8C86DRAFT_2436161, partial [Haematococcus lacustris]